jgi:Ala-tRNA(Pro) deacylase
MPGDKIRRFLDENDVRYASIQHSRAYTAQEVAESAHVPGHELAKTVMVKLDGALAMAVVPAVFNLDLELLRGAAGADTAVLATEAEFSARFPDCQPGAMPPFGNLYGMSVYADEGLSDEEMIAFNAGSHVEIIRMAYADFERLVAPKLARIADVP